MLRSCEKKVSTEGCSAEVSSARHTQPRISALRQQPKTAPTPRTKKRVDRPANSWKGETNELEKKNGTSNVLPMNEQIKIGKNMEARDCEILPTANR